MSAVEMIKTAIARIKAAKEKLRTWLTNAGVTVPDGTKLDGMVDMLNDVPVSSGDAWEITDASRLFYGGARVELLDLFIKHISKYCFTNEAMFYNAKLSGDIDLSSLKSEYSTSFSYMFFNNQNIKSIILGFSDAKNVKYTNGMFSSCTLLSEVDLSNIKTSSKLIRMDEMFYQCYNIKSVNISNFDTSGVTNMSKIFHQCKKLEEIIGFSATNKAGLSIGFPLGNSGEKYALKRLTFRTDLPDGQYSIRSAINIGYCAFTRDGIIEMFGTLPDISSLGLSASYKKITITGNPCVTGTLSDGTACDVLTDTDRAIATSKGWTLVE